VDDRKRGDFMIRKEPIKAHARLISGKHLSLPLYHQVDRAVKKGRQSAGISLTERIRDSGNLSILSQHGGSNEKKRDDGKCMHGVLFCVLWQGSSWQIKSISNKAKH